MHTKQKNVQLALWMAFIVLFAGFLRFYQLGELALDNRQAQTALDAVDFGSIHGNVLTVAVNGGLFWLFGATNAAARSLGAFAGIGLVLAPLLFRKMLGDRGVILFSAGLAFESSLVVLSRIVDGRILTVLLFGLVIGFLFNKKIILAGIAMGLFLLSGESVGYVLTLTLLVVLWSWISDRDTVKGMLRDWSAKLPQAWWKIVLLSSTLTFFLIGSSFGLRLNGLSAAIGDWFGFLQSWGQADKLATLAQVGITILAYGLFPLVFGLWGMANTLRSRDESRLVHLMVRWLILALALILVHPGRQSVDLVWLLIPLWWFSAQQVDRLLDAYREVDWVRLAAFAFLFILLCFIVLNWAGVINAEYDPQKVILRWAVIGGTVILSLLVFVLVGYGWGTESSVLSAVAAVGLFLLAFQITGGAWKSTGLAPSGPQTELWQTTNYPSQLNLMTETLDQLGEYNHGDPGFLEVVMVGMDEPALEWALRNYDIQTVTTLNPGDSPEIVISNNTSGELWGDNYRGQDFVYRESVNWSLLYPKEWQKWLLHRQVPLQQEWTVLWARTDLFPGSEVEVVTE